MQWDTYLNIHHNFRNLLTGNQRVNTIQYSLSKIALKSESFPSTKTSWREGSENIPWQSAGATVQQTLTITPLLGLVYADEHIPTFFMPDVVFVNSNSMFNVTRLAVK
jgi:hypothetical protein